MEKTLNHICKTCGKEYWACNACDKKNIGLSWRSVACSPECFLIYVDACEAENQKALQTIQGTQVELQEETKIVVENTTEQVISE